MVADRAARGERGRHLGPVLLLGLRVHVREASQDERLHQRPLHGAGQEVQRRAAAGELLRQAPPVLALDDQVRPAAETQGVSCASHAVRGRRPGGRAQALQPGTCIQAPLVT